MSPAEALSELTDVSNQIREAVVLEREGGVLASTLSDDERAREFAEAARAALEAAGRLRGGRAGVTAARGGGSRGQPVRRSRGRPYGRRDDRRPTSPPGSSSTTFARCLRRLGPAA